ncbi:nucleoprotein TPR isoform X2 [Prorops nasuta]|uniref:nucleoprotein TPR isoform X2 n=1 Tax=Prorops nasuta TaxID=863751 RepID=UPI0034CFDD0C
MSMESQEETEHDVLKDILDEDELAQIPESVGKKLKIYFNEKCEEFITAKAIFETNRQSLEEQVETIQKDLNEKKADLVECKGELEIADKYNSELKSNLEEAKRELTRVQENVKRLERESIELRRQRDDAVDERNFLQSQIERMDADIARMRVELSSLTSQLQSAITAKCQALTETEEIRSREMTLDFKEKRLEQERTLIAQQMAGLEEELAKRTAELQATRAEASTRALLTDTRLSQREEEIRIANETIVQLKEVNSTLQRRRDELAQKLEEQRTQDLSMYASYQEEIVAQTRLADLYKGIADDANSKADEFSKAVKELQEILEQATEQFGNLETKHNELQLKYEQDIKERDQAIGALSKELEMANDLLKNIKQERLDIAVEQLAPTAAIASKVLKKGLSLTQIYTQLVETVNELTMEREENERLKSQMDVILRELEEKAPVVLQLREDYDTAVANVATLSTKLDELLVENNRLQETTDAAERIANHHTKENQQLKTQMTDLARQVCFLLKEVQESRSGSTVRNNDLNNSMETDDLASSHIISKKLVTFRDIEELQENNQKLLSIVRTLSSRQEEIERATDEINSGAMKEKLESYVEQLEDMKAAQERQAKMLDGLLRQRDMYKNMYQQSLKRSAPEGSENKEEASDNSEMKDKTSGDKEVSTKQKELEEKLKDSEAKLKQITVEFETYRKEKTAHERMLGEEVERLRKEAEINSSKCCRLKAQLDSANERFQILQGNVGSYKAQIKALEEKCCNYTITIGKHEQSLMILKDEALSAQSKLSRAEVQLENLRQERQILRDSESRLSKEREVYQRERQTQAMLRADVQAIKASLERVQAESVLRSEHRLDDVTRECAALRRRLQEEQDRFRELTSHLEKQLAAAQDRLNEERTVAETLREELAQVRNSEAEHVQKIEELSGKLRQAASNSISKPISGDVNLTNRIKELEVQLVNTQSEAKSLRDQLKVAHQQSQQYCDIAESVEAQLREMTVQHNKTKEELENALKESRVEILNNHKRIKDLGDELLRVSSGKQETDSELRERLSEAQRKLETLDEIKGELELVKSDLQAAAQAAKEAEEKYTREMMLHSTDLQMLTKFKEESQVFQQTLATLTQERDSALESLQMETSLYKEREKKLHEELSETQKRIVDLDAQNSLLHNQLQELSDKIAIQQSKMGEQESNMDTSVESLNRSFADEDSKSTEQLLKVMKYLRREKDLAVAKVDVLRAENLRLKAQIEISEKRLKDTEQQLNSEREKSEIDVVTTSKHAELLRKVETLNAITDSNRVLREERDQLNSKVNELMKQVNDLSEEVVPLRNTCRDLTAKVESLSQENTSLKGDVTRWRQRANSLVEKVNRASPEDWRRLQTERENLSKLLTSEREIHAKRFEEFNQLKADKTKLDSQVAQLQKQVHSLSEQLGKESEEARKLGQDLNDALTDSNVKAKDLMNLKKELGEKEVLLTDVRNKEIQIRKIAKKYKTQFEELAKTVEEEKAKAEAKAAGMEETAQMTQEREDQLREEGRTELRQANQELKTEIEELMKQIASLHEDGENMKKEIDILNKASVEKEARAKQVLKGARTRIMQLTEAQKVSEKELFELKTKIESGAGDQDCSEHESRIVALKSKMEGRISRLEHEKTEIQNEKETLVQKVAQLQRQLTGASGVSPTSEPPTANIKPMSARSETPLASIRPMSVVQSRTAAVLPTTASAPVLVAPHQQAQQVHTTETSSPTSSLTDFQPASTSTPSASGPLRQVVQPQLSETAESTQREDSENVENITVLQQPCQQPQQQQQAVALVSPRVEQQQQQQQQQAVASETQQTVASSSTQSVSTSQTQSGHKRPRQLDSTASGSGIVEGLDLVRQDQAPSPKSKRSRTDGTVAPSASISEIEYQVPTSSQRDQDEEVEEGCIVVVDCDEGEGGSTHQVQEEEEFENDTYEEMEEEEELPYEVGVEVERDNNEVEIIMEDDSAGVEVPRQPSGTLSTNQQQQSEAISSAGQTGEPPFNSRAARGIAPMPRQQQQQHLLLPQQGYEDGGDDSIVPSTPTLFIPRRADGFAEAVSSPQVPQGRFTFGDSSGSSGHTPASSSHAVTTNPAARTIFSSSTTGVAPVIQESIDDSRMDLAQLEDAGTGRSVPTTPLQTSGSSEDQESPISVTPVIVVSHASGPEINEEQEITNIRIISPEEQEHGQKEGITESGTAQSDGVTSESEKQLEEGGTSASVEDDSIGETEVEVTDEGGSELVGEDADEQSREAEASPSSNTRQRAAAAAAAAANGSRGSIRRPTRSSYRATTRTARPTPIVWSCHPERSQSPGRGQVTRGGINNEGTARGRSTRGRRMRGKFPFHR